MHKSERYYTESHEWLEAEGLTGTVGITEFAKNELGEIVHIELPSIGSLVQAGKEVCVLESTKAAVDVYSPASGEIIAVNEMLRVNPAALKEQDEWLFKINLSHPREIENLLRETQYFDKVTHS